jgi:hypothetical protein
VDNIKFKKPNILFTLDFDADPGAGDAPFIGWDIFVAESFDRRDDFRCVVNFEGVGLEKLIANNTAFEKLNALVDDGRIFCGNHSWDHPSFTGEYTGGKPMSRAEQADQLLRTQEFISEHLAIPKFFRAPFFDHNHDTLQLICQLGIRYDLSEKMPDDEFAPLQPYEYFLPTWEPLVRIPTNLKLSPIEWPEPIREWSGEMLEPGLYNVIVHSREFHEPEQAEEMLARLKRMMVADFYFAGPEDIEAML